MKMKSRMELLPWLQGYFYGSRQKEPKGLKEKSREELWYLYVEITGAAK